MSEPANPLASRREGLFFQGSEYFATENSVKNFSPLVDIVFWYVV